MPVLGFYGAAILGIMGSLSLLHLGALSVRLSWTVSCFNGCVFCEVQLCLLSCSCEYFSSVPSYRVQWSVNGGQEQMDCGSSHQGCVSEVLSGIHAL